LNKGIIIGVAVAIIIGVAAIAMFSTSSEIEQVPEIQEETRPAPRDLSVNLNENLGISSGG